MKELDRGTRIYILATMGAALAIALHLFPSASLTFSAQFLTLAVIGAITAPHHVHLGMRVEMSISHPFILATMILIGEAEAVLLSATCIASLCIFRIPRMALFRALFNIASFIITTFLACETYHAFGGSNGGAPGDSPMLALMLSTLVFYLSNTYSISGVVALSNRLNLFKVWQDNFLWSAPSFLAGGSLALGMSYFLDRFGIYSFILALPFCVLIYYSYKLYLDKLEEKRQHLQDIQRMNADLERKVRERTQELEVVNQKLLESNRELQRANSMKSEFLANMSHELRTPLNAIIGFSELLMDNKSGSLNGHQRDYVADILSSGRHLLELINDILDLSKIEAGQMRLNLETFDLGTALEEAMSLLRVESSRKQIDLTAHITCPGLQIQADRSKLKQATYNLLSNAVKFTPAGGAVSVQAMSDGETVNVSVIDSGIGIEEEDQERIFQAFTQVDGSLARQYQGTGLGLALVKKFVEMHGGRVRVESRVGVGSSLLFSIPVTQEDPASPPNFERVPMAESTADGERQSPPGAELSVPRDSRPTSGGGPHLPSYTDENLILVVEDNPSNMRLVSGLLKSQGYGVVEKCSGEDALDALKFLSPRLILMDIQLPGMDGLQVARVLRDDPETREIPVIALTAHAMKGDEIRAREAGCAGYISKPIETSQFTALIAELLRGGAPGNSR